MTKCNKCEVILMYRQVKYRVHSVTNKLHKYKFICSNCYKGRVKVLNKGTNRMVFAN